MWGGRGCEQNMHLYKFDYTSSGEADSQSESLVLVARQTGSQSESLVLVARQAANQNGWFTWLGV
jgi:hypothetical protein